MQNKCRIIERKNLTIKTLRIKNTGLEKKVSNNFSFTHQLMSSLKQTETQNKIDDLTTKFDDSNKSLNESLQENEWLREIVQNVSKEVITYSENKFTSELRQCIYSLLQCNLSATNVEPVINCVPSRNGRQANKLSSRTTVQRMNIKRLILSQKQIAELETEKHHFT